MIDEFEQLPEPIRIKILAWIDERIRRSTSAIRTSYGLKHDLQFETGIYVKDNQFKGAMLVASYKPLNTNEFHWRYRVTLRKREKYARPKYAVADTD